MDRKRIFAMLVVAMLLCVAVPITAASYHEASAQQGLDRLRDGLAEAGCEVEARGGVEYVTIGDSEYELLGLAVAFTIGLAMGYLLGNALPASPDTSGITQEDVNQAVRDGEAGKVMAALDAAKGMASAILPADAEMWRFTIPYWQRAAEYSVAEAWSPDAEADLDGVLQGIDLYGNAARYLHDWSEALDVAYNSYSSYPAGNWDQPALESMALRISWDGGSLSGGTPVGPSYSLWSDFCQHIRASTGRDVAFVYNGPHPEGSSSQHSGTIYNLGAGAARITSTDTGSVYVLDAGANRMASVYCESTQATGPLPTGTYRFEHGRQFAGPMVPSPTTGAADLSGALVFGHGPTVYYALSDSRDGKGTVAIHGGSGALVRESSTLRYEVSYVGRGGQTTIESAIFGRDSGNASATYDVVGAYNELVASLEYVVAEVCADATATWAIFDILEEADTAISPSALRGMAGDMQISAAEYIALGIQMLIQSHDAYKRDADAIESGKVNINPESLSLYCYGDIYKNGILWAEGVAFTPYINNTNQSLAVGRNQWAGTGHAMIWWQGDDLSMWSGSASLSSYTYVAMDPGTTIDLKQIVRDRVNVPSVLLTKSNIVEYVPEADVPSPPPDVPQVTGSRLAAHLMTATLCSLALVAFMAGRELDMEELGVIAAIALAAVGLLFPDVMVDIVTGNFHLGLPRLW